MVGFCVWKREVMVVNIDFADPGLLPGEQGIPLGAE